MYIILFLSIGIWKFSTLIYIHNTCVFLTTDGSQYRVTLLRVTSIYICTFIRHGHNFLLFFFYRWAILINERTIVPKALFDTFYYIVVMNISTKDYIINLILNKTNYHITDYLPMYTITTVIVDIVLTFVCAGAWQVHYRSICTYWRALQPVLNFWFRIMTFDLCTGLFIDVFINLTKKIRRKILSVLSIFRFFEITLLLMNNLLYFYF